MLNFFLFCSGANVAILKKHCSRGEQHKYAGIGAVVFFTAVMATLSASYALYTIFENPITSLAFGVLWGLMIFNLDRFILSTMKRRSGAELEESEYLKNVNIPGEMSFGHNYSQLEEEKYRNKRVSNGGLWMQAIPRLALAVIIAVVISKPLEMKIFEKEIDQVLLEQKNDLRLENKEQVGSLYMPEINSLDYEISRLRNEIDHKETQADELYATFIAEAEGTAGTGLRGRGPVFKEKKEKYDEILTELSMVKATNTRRIEQLESQKAELLAQYEQAVVQGEPVIDNVDGLMARIRALNELPKTPSLFIMLLFLCIETAPILAKLLAPSGGYERWLAKYEENDKINWTLETFRDRAFYQHKALEYQKLSTQPIHSAEDRSRLTSEYLRTYNKIRMEDQQEIEDSILRSRRREDDGNDDDGNIWDPRIVPDGDRPGGGGNDLDRFVSENRPSGPVVEEEEDFDALGRLLGEEVVRNQAIVENAHKSLEERDKGVDPRLDAEEQGGRFTTDPFGLNPYGQDRFAGGGEDEVGPSINNFYREMKKKQLRRMDARINGTSSMDQMS